MINRGSEWRKWDLHLHTPSSYDYQYKESDANQKIIDALIKNDIEAVAVTDHFLIDRKRIENLRKLAPEIKFFPGVELRTDKGDTNIHVILIFSDELDLDNLCSDFEYFKRNKAEAKDSNETIYWDYKDIQKFATERGALISIHAGSKSNGIDDRITNALKHNQAVKSEYAESVHVFEMGKQADISGYKTGVFPSIGIRPLILSSDNHDPRNYNDEKCLWIKSDLTFEGLKQILYEPEERVSYSKSHPDEKDKNFVIDKIEFFDGEVLYLNSGLNTIIGGRSTGKSTLLNSIAEHQNNKNFKPEKHYTFGKDHPIKVFWKDEQLNIEREVEFIPHEFMVELSYNPTLLSNLLREIVSKKDKDTEERKYQTKLDDINSDVRLKLDTYFQLLRNKNELLKPEGEEEGVRNTIGLLTKEIEKIRLENEFSEEDNQIFREKSIEHENLKDQTVKINEDLDKLSELKEMDLKLEVDLAGFSDETKNLIQYIVDIINEQSINYWKSELERIDSKLEAFKLKTDEDRQNIEKSEIYIKGKELESKNEQLKNLEERLSKNQALLKELNEYQEKVSINEEKCNSLANEIVDKYIEYYKAFIEFKRDFLIEENELRIEIRENEVDITKAINYFDERKADNIKFIGSLNKALNEALTDLNLEKLKLLLLTVFENRTLSFNGGKKLDDLINDVFSNNWIKFEYIITYQEDEFMNMSQGKKSFVILKLILEFIDDKKPVLIDQPEDSLDNRTIYDELRKYVLDTKKQRQVIIVTHNPNIVIGSDAENVIVANQHSFLQKNSTGNKFQYINGALENTKKKNEKCEFILESQGIREHIFDVLEGGKEAFAKREQKYGYKSK